MDVDVSRYQPSVPFRPFAALSNPHLQTMFAQVLRPLWGPKVRRERWETSDRDFIDVDLLDAPREAPHLFLLHGLEGSSRSGYVLAMLRAAAARGWGALALNFRSCSGEPNRIARSYCSGETQDPLFAIGKLREAGVTGRLFGVGVSLGGNVLLKLLADSGDRSPLDAAVAISTPYDLDACARQLDTSGGLNTVYRQVFIRALKAKALDKARRHPELDAERIRRVRGIADFDDAVTAPLYGYRDARDYYRQCASGYLLDRIRTPTLLISSEDDPIAPLSPVFRQVSTPWLRWLITEHGGHVGFIGGHGPGLRFWAEEIAAEFLGWTLSEQAQRAA